MASSSVNTFDIDGLRGSEFTKIQIVLPARKGRTAESVVGFVTQDFAYSAGAEYSSTMNDSGTIDQVYSAGNAAMGALGSVGIGSGSASQKTVKQLATTIEKFSGFQKPTFNVPLLFVATQPGDDVRKEIIKLLPAGYPDIPNGQLNFYMEAPFGYGTNVDLKTQQLTSDGTCSLSIGKWFKANNLLITGMSYTFSKEVIGSGKPLYARVELTMTPYRLITLDEASSYISG